MISMVETLKRLPALDLYRLESPLPLLPPLILLFALLRGLLFLAAAIPAGLLVDGLGGEEGEAQRLIHPDGDPGGAAVKPCGKDEPPRYVADVVHLRDQQHVHHEDQAQQSHHRHRPQPQYRHLHENCSEGASVPREVEIARVVVGDCEAEESGTPPDDVVGVGEFRYIEEDGGADEEKAGEGAHPPQVLHLSQPAQMKQYQIIPKTRIHRSIITCPVPINAFPARLSWLLLPSQAALLGSRTSCRLAARVALWQASQMQAVLGWGSSSRQRIKPVMRRRAMLPLNAMWSYRWGSTDS